MRYLEMIEADSKTSPVPVLRKLAKVLRGVRTSALLGEAPSEAHEGPVNPWLAVPISNVHAPTPIPPPPTAHPTP